MSRRLVPVLGIATLLAGILWLLLEATLPAYHDGWSALRPLWQVGSVVAVSTAWWVAGMAFAQGKAWRSTGTGIIAPLLLAYPWSLEPSLFGFQTVGFRYFLLWLTKYPNLGPIHGEVAAGIGCVVLSSFLPCIFAILVWRGTLSKPAAWVFVGLQLLAYVPWFVHIDLVFITLPLSSASWASGQWATALFCGQGALSRLTLTVMMVGTAAWGGLPLSSTAEKTA